MFAFNTEAAGTSEMQQVKNEPQSPSSPELSSLQTSDPEWWAGIVTQRPKRSAHEESRKQAAATIKNVGRTIKKERGPPKPRKLTECRQEVLRKFLLETSANPLKYGQIASYTWTEELIGRLKKRNGSTGNVTSSDVRSWLETLKMKEQNNASNSIPVQIQASSSTTTSALPPSECRENGGIATEQIKPKMMNEGMSHLPSSTEKVCPVPANTLENQKVEAQLAGTSSSTMAAQPSASTKVDIAQQNLLHEQRQLLEEINATTDNDITVYVQTGGFVIQVPPCAFPTILFIQPTGWNVSHQDPIVENDTSLISCPIIISNDDEHNQQVSEQPSSNISMPELNETIFVAEPNKSVSEAEMNGDKFGAVPQGNVSGAVPQGNVSGAEPPVNVSGAEPPVNVSGAEPPANVSGAEPPANVSGSAPAANVFGAAPLANVSGAELNTNVLRAEMIENISGAELNTNGLGAEMIENISGAGMETNGAEIGMNDSGVSLEPSSVSLDQQMNPFLDDSFIGDLEEFIN